MKTRNNQSHADETLLNQSITRRSFVKRSAVASAATVFGVAILSPSIANAVENGVYGYDITLPIPANGLSNPTGLGNNQGPNANGLPDGPDVGELIKKALAANGGTVKRTVSGYYDPCQTVFTPGPPSLGLFRNPDGSASILNINFGASSTGQPTTITITVRWGTPH